MGNILFYYFEAQYVSSVRIWLSCKLQPQKLTYCLLIENFIVVLRSQSPSSCFPFSFLNSQWKFNEALMCLNWFFSRLIRFLAIVGVFIVLGFFLWKVFKMEKDLAKTNTELSEIQSNWEDTTPRLNIKLRGRCSYLI